MVQEAEKFQSVLAGGEKQEAAYSKFMCYSRTTGGGRAMGVDASTIHNFDLKKDERDAQAQLLLNGFMECHDDTDLTRAEKKECLTSAMEVVKNSDESNAAEYRQGTCS